MSLEIFLESEVNWQDGLGCLTPDKSLAVGG